MFDPLNISRDFGDAPFRTRSYTVEVINDRGIRTRQCLCDSLARAKDVGEQYFYEEAKSANVFINRPKGQILIARSDGRSTGPRFSHRVVWKSHRRFGETS